MKIILCIVLLTLFYGCCMKKRNTQLNKTLWKREGVTNRLKRKAEIEDITESGSDQPSQVNVLNRSLSLSDLVSESNPRENNTNSNESVDSNDTIYTLNGKSDSLDAVEKFVEVENLLTTHQNRFGKVRSIPNLPLLSSVLRKRSYSVSGLLHSSKSTPSINYSSNDSLTWDNFTAATNFESHSAVSTPTNPNFLAEDIQSIVTIMDPQRAQDMKKEAIHLKHLYGVVTRRMQALNVENLEDNGVDGCDEELNEIRDKADMFDEEVGVFGMNFGDVVTENAPSIANERHDVTYWENKLTTLHSNILTHRNAIKKKG